MPRRRPPARRPRGNNVFRLEGEYWTVVFDGTVVRVGDARGMHHLAFLLRNANQRISAWALEHGAASSAREVEATPAEHERARVNVTRALHAALRRIAAHAEALVAHLRLTIRTGTFCSYSPDPRAPIGWVVEVTSIPSSGPEDGRPRRDAD